MTTFTSSRTARRTTAHIDSGGTMWRLRSLVAMGHDATRIAHALGVHQRTIQKILCGGAPNVTADACYRAHRLWDAWWDKRPPELTGAQRSAAAAARHSAELLGWCTPLALDEDVLDEPGYRPRSRWRAASGKGTAREFPP